MGKGEGKRGRNRKDTGKRGGKEGGLREEPEIAEGEKGRVGGNKKGLEGRVWG